MSARTIEELHGYLSDEIIWRKRELSAIRSLVQEKSNSLAKRKALLRSAIMLLYAHWEGFVKSAGAAYIQFVANQRLLHDELSDNFLALAIKPMLHQAMESKQATDQINLVEFFRGNLDSRAVLQPRANIDTQSNLSSSIFHNIIDMLGLDYTLYPNGEKFIDKKLLHTRNTVAHGNYIDIDQNEFLELYDKIIEMMDIFRNQIGNAASQKLYCK